MDSETRYDPQGLVRLDETTCWDFLRDRNIGRVAVIHLGRPSIYPVNYAIDGQSVVFRTAPGSKLIAASRSAPVAFEVDEADRSFETGTSVVVHGEIVEVTDRAERERLEQLPIRPWAPGARDHMVRIDPQWVSGRAIPMRGDEDALGVDGG